MVRKYVHISGIFSLCTIYQTSAVEFAFRFGMREIVDSFVSVQRYLYTTEAIYFYNLTRLLGPLAKFK